MPNPGLSILFMGTPPYAAVSLERLLAGRHRVAAVLTRPDKPAGRGKKLQASAVKTMAIEHGIEVLDPPSARDPALHTRVAELAPDVGVCVAYGRILPKELLELPRLGCINAHGSLLPRLRGAAPIERAILEGYDETGVTIMRMNERMDEGDMLMRRAVPITASTEAGGLRETLAALSAELFVEALDALEAGTAAFTPQDHGAATYAPPLERREAAIDWNCSADEIDRRVRAFAPAPGAFTFDGERRLKILACRPLPAAPGGGTPGCILSGVSEASGLVVRCGRGAIAVLTVQPEGKRSMSAADYVRGCRDLPPDRRLG